MWFTVFPLQFFGVISLSHGNLNLIDRVDYAADRIYRKTLVRDGSIYGVLSHALTHRLTYRT